VEKEGGREGGRKNEKDGSNLLEGLGFFGAGLAVERELGGSGGLARPLQTSQEDDGGRFARLREGGRKGEWEGGREGDRCSPNSHIRGTMKREGGREGGREGRHVGQPTWISSDCSAPMRSTSSSYMILMNSWSGVTPFVTSMPGRGRERRREGGREGRKGECGLDRCPRKCLH